MGLRFVEKANSNYETKALASKFFRCELTRNGLLNNVDSFCHLIPCKPYFLTVIWKQWNKKE